LPLSSGSAGVLPKHEKHDVAANKSPESGPM